MSYGVENRLTAVSGAVSASVRHVTKYYCFPSTGSGRGGGQRVALRENGTLYWLLTDHLGSTAITASADGTTELAELRYKAWGEYRDSGYAPSDTPTTYHFTGQREDATIQLLFYNARFYDAALGRFIQADTIVPNPADPQALNRYSYVRNNPLRYIDPSGHGICDNPGGGSANPDCQDYQENLATLEAAQQACLYFGLGTGCYLYEGAIWHTYFTGSGQGAEDYINATGLAAGDEGAYRAAVARNWSGYAYGQGLIEGEQNLNFWPNARGATPEQRAMVMLAFAGPGVADVTRFLKDHFSTPSFSAAGLGENIYPHPGVAEDAFSYVSAVDEGLAVSLDELFPGPPWNPNELKAEVGTPWEPQGGWESWGGWGPGGWGLDQAPQPTSWKDWRGILALLMYASQVFAGDE